MRAARRWGGVAAFREALQAPAESDMVALYTRYQTAARMAVNQAAWFAAWTEGERLASDALLSTDD